LTKEILEQIITFKKQFKENFDYDIIPCRTNKIYHYFEIVNDTKVVSKDALKEIYQDDCIELFKFFRSNNKLLPMLLNETNNFFIFEYLEGEVMIDIAKEDFDYLEQFEGSEFYPFVNSLYSNLIRTSNGIKLMDLKHLDNKVTNLPDKIKDTLIVYMNNNDNNISNLYVRDEKYLDDILEILIEDYHIMNVIKI